MLHGADGFECSARSAADVQHLTVFGRELRALTYFSYAFHIPWPQLDEVAVYQGGPHCDSADFA